MFPYPRSIGVRLVDGVGARLPDGAPARCVQILRRCELWRVSAPRSFSRLQRSLQAFAAMGSGASHERPRLPSRPASEADISTSHPWKKPVTVFYNPGSSNSLSCAIMGRGSAARAQSDPAHGRAEERGFGPNPYGQVPGMTDESNGLNLGESTAILRYLRSRLLALPWHHCRAGQNRYGTRNSRNCIRALTW